MAPNRRRNRNYILATASLLVIVVAAIITAGCTASTSTPGAVAGPSWSLDSYLAGNGTLVPVLPGTEITAAFGPDGKVTGSAGCNGYGGDYRLDGTTLSVSSLVQTLKLCTEPEGIMEQEARFMDLLGSAAECRIEDDRLIITDAEGTDVLVFVKGPAAAALAGTSWTLTSLSDEGGAMIPVLTGTAVTMVFDADGNVGGSAGCNHYGAGYTVDAAFLTIEPAVRTEMYCSEPPGIMKQEDRYLALLAQVASYRIEDDRLILADSEGADLLVFEKAAQTPDLPLVGTDWVLDSYATGGDAISSVIAGAAVTVTFGPDGNVGGNAGCNHYGGRYTLDGTTLSVSTLFNTLMYCETPGVMRQESAYLALLGNATSYRVEDDRLVLTDETGTDLLFFVQAEEVPPAPLAGTEWTLESSSLNGETVSSVIAGTTVTATFSSEGRVTGNAGCNSYGAGYVLDGTKITIEPPISTKMYCNDPEGVMEQESTYLNLLPSVSSYRVEGNHLVLSDATGADLLFFMQALPGEGRWMFPPDGGPYDLLDEDGNIVASY
ncbi:MAG: META domain-containing protein [Methanomicrobiales archaeon HGW-Methanomicrobiales-2]|jgi:heat shock protein HslJ|nr:MAG: META domain-containing protein [Methanomicrobiales archaeon HGW-Methanomicrobiales-2]